MGGGVIGMDNYIAINCIAVIIELRSYLDLDKDKFVSISDMFAVKRINDHIKELEQLSDKLYKQVLNNRVA